MKLEYSKNINIDIGEKFYGLIGASTRTYEGVYEIEVANIDWNGEYVIFNIEQPCQQVMAFFYEMDKYVFKTEEEAKNAYDILDSLDGLMEYY